jgi:hypothetical protein
MGVRPARGGVISAGLVIAQRLRTGKTLPVSDETARLHDELAAAKKRLAETERCAACHSSAEARRVCPTGRRTAPHRMSTGMECAAAVATRVDSAHERTRVRFSPGLPVAAASMGSQR